VQKYIEPCGIRSPQNSVLKRIERQNLRSQQTVFKSQKKLDIVFKLDTVLTKAVESFNEIDLTNTDETQSMSLDDTPAVEIVKTSDLNDTDPICPELLDCMDPIDNIAVELSSPTMKMMFLKEMEGKIATISDLAKMTELEINRLCIKAPKVKIAKKVLIEYAAKRLLETEPKQVTVDNENYKINLEVQDIENRDTVIQKNYLHAEVQTAEPILSSVSVQTERQVTSQIVQTKESGCKSTKEIIESCLAEVCITTRYFMYFKSIFF
jgi:hypothetical protein